MLQDLFIGVFDGKFPLGQANWLDNVLFIRYLFTSFDPHELRLFSYFFACEPASEQGRCAVYEGMVEGGF